MRKRKEFVNTDRILRNIKQRIAKDIYEADKVKAKAEAVKILQKHKESIREAINGHSKPGSKDS